MYRIFLYLLIPALAICNSCKKLLDARPDNKINTPSGLSDLDGMLDNSFDLNEGMPVLGEVCSDNYYVTNSAWAATSELHRNLYCWQKFDQTRADWNKPYRIILIANTILEHLPKFRNENSTRAAMIGASALFIRGYSHFVASQHFAKTYNKVTAINDMGVPMRLNTDYNEPSDRGTVEQTYAQIIKDLKASIADLPIFPQFKYRPSQPAAYAVLARCYLVMQDYENAALYADSCLRLYNKLIDYNSIDIASTIPFERFNDEVIYTTVSSPGSILSQARAKVDTTLYTSYIDGDLRKKAFFKKNSDNSYAFKGNYTGLSTAAMFTGIATDEMYLIRAECLARAGEVKVALDDLNLLLEKRWDNTLPYVRITASSPEDALILILKERRKELLFRNLRWSDLRRLNLEEKFQVTLTRYINDITYVLPPNGNRYTLQISDNALFYSNMPQNP